MAEPSTPVAELMSRKVKSVPARLDQEQAARMVSQYDFVALPVVSDDGKMVGVITVDDILDIIQEEATEDIQRLGGSQPLESPYLHAGFWSIFRKRIGWLALFFIAGTLTSNILSHYESMLTSMVALSFFIPLLIGTGGNAGAQTSTLVIRAMAMGEITTKDTLKVIGREILLGLAWVGLGGHYLYPGRNPGRAQQLGTDRCGRRYCRGCLQLLHRRPDAHYRQAAGTGSGGLSAPMITTLVDACGLIIYFQFARLMLGLH